MRFRTPIAALIGMVILSAGIRHADPLRAATLETRMFSVPVSPSVVASIANRDGDLAMLALWRGSPRWYGSGTALSSSSGGGQDGALHVSVQYGSVSLNLLFERSHSLADPV